jgi:hypothetical protein
VCPGVKALKYIEKPQPYEDEKCCISSDDVDRTPQQHRFDTMPETQSVASHTAAIIQPTMRAI